MEDAGGHAKRLVDEAQAHRTPTSDGENLLLAGPHGCSQGWKYTEAGFAYRCPECKANDEIKRVAEKVRQAGVGERYWDTSWDDLEMVEPMPKLRESALDIGGVLASGDHLLLSGPPGSGKTQAAVLLIKAAIENHHTAALLNLGRAAMEIRAAYNTDGGPTEAEVARAHASPDLLVIDDLAAGETTSASVEQRLLYLILEERQNNTRSTVVTTNLAPKELSERLGQRLIGRLQPLAIMQFQHGRNFRAPTGKTRWER